MGGDSYQTAGASGPMDNLANYLWLQPVVQSIANQQMAPTARAEAGAGSILSNANNASTLRNLQTYALPEARVGQQIERENSLSGAQTLADTMAGPGARSAEIGNLLNRAMNPEYYQAAGAASDASKRLIDSISTTGLSPGEAAATERGMNQYNQDTGNAALTNPTKVLSDAVNFGGAYNTKLQLLNQAIGGATGVAGATASNAGFNPVATAMSQPSPQTMSNFGSGQFTNTNPTTSSGVANNVFGYNQGMFGALTGNNSASTQAGASMANATSPAAYLNAV